MSFTKTIKCLFNYKDRYITLHRNFIQNVKNDYYIHKLNLSEIKYQNSNVIDNEIENEIELEGRVETGLW